MQVIYADVLIILNTIITFILLLAVARLLHIHVIFIRLIGASFVGGISALIIFLPDMGIILSAVVKFLLSFIICTLAFAPETAKSLLRGVLLFFAVSFSFAGAMMGLSALGDNSIIHYLNGYTYIELSAASLIFSCVLFYLLLNIFSKLTAKKISDTISCTVICENTLKIEGIIDSGCVVTDPVTGELIVIVPIKKAEAIADESVKEYFNGEPLGKLRLIPIKTVSGSSLLPCIRRDIKVEIDGSVHNLGRVLVAFTNKDTEVAVVPMALISDLAGEEKCLRKLG